MKLFGKVDLGVNGNAASWHTKDMIVPQYVSPLSLDLYRIAGPQNIVDHGNHSLAHWLMNWYSKIVDR